MRGWPCWPRWGGGQPFEGRPQIGDGCRSGAPCVCHTCPCAPPDAQFVPQCSTLLPTHPHPPRLPAPAPAALHFHPRRPQVCGRDQPHRHSHRAAQRHEDACLVSRLGPLLRLPCSSAIFVGLCAANGVAAGTAGGTPAARQALPQNVPHAAPRPAACGSVSRAGRVHAATHDRTVWAHPSLTS